MEGNPFLTNPVFIWSCAGPWLAEMAVIEWEVMMRDLDNNTLAQMLKLVSEEWASIGVTTISTRLPFPKVMSGYARLAEIGQMPIRLDAHYEVHRMPTDPVDTREFYHRSGVLQGLGGEIGNLGLEEFAAFNRADYERFGKLIRDANVKVEK